VYNVCTVCVLPSDASSRTAVRHVNQLQGMPTHTRRCVTWQQGGVECVERGGDMSCDLDRSRTCLGVVSTIIATTMSEVPPRFSSPEECIISLMKWTVQCVDYDTLVLISLYL